VLCEIGLSTFRGREVLYPNVEEFGKSTQASNKDYMLDWSHFQILADLIGARGIEPDSDKAVFEAVDIRTSAGGVRLKLPVFTAALGSTQVAKEHWDGLAVGAALSGTVQVIGENVCGMDPEAKFKDGKVAHSEDLKHRVDKFREFWDGKHGDIAVQTNVEDQRMGVDIYVISKLEVDVIERKWGQGAKAIGGEVRVTELEEALMLKRRGYIVIPDPEDPIVQDAFKAGTFRSFERHSRVGMPQQREFIEDIEWLREQGAKKVFLKTGAYRPAVVAFTMKCASEARIDLVTFDGAGGGTAMSPVPMMQECGTPTVYLEAQVLRCIELLKRKGKHVPDIAMAGGFVNEAQIFKAIAMSNLGKGPHVKAVAMSRAPLTAVMKASYFTELARDGKLPRAFVDVYGASPEQFFIATPKLKSIYGERFKQIPPEAIGLYTYYFERLGTGLKQLMAGCRKWKLDLLGREDIVSLSDRARKATGIQTVDELEMDAIKSILG
jgi:glutamate synthase domain-containing protein 2